MSIREDLDKAIAAHGQWKVKLRRAIDTGEAESTPARVRQDNNCSFGKWLHQRIDAQHKASPFYAEVVDLHARFHREAGTILELALAGRAEEAARLIGIGSPFSSLSGQLTRRMQAWRESL